MSTYNLRKKVVPVSPTPLPSWDDLPSVLRGQTPPLGTSAEARRGSAQTVPRDRRHHKLIVCFQINRTCIILDVLTNSLTPMFLGHTVVFNIFQGNHVLKGANMGSLMIGFPFEAIVFFMF